MTPTDEFVPLEHFQRLARWWWVVVLCAMLGGAVGFAAHRSRPPVYQAQAVFLASIDFNKIDFYHPPSPTPVPYHLTQYDEDLSLAVIDVCIRSAAQPAAEAAQKAGLAVDAQSLIDNSTIERRHANWTLSYRSSDPRAAQTVTNLWADAALAEMKASAQDGRMKPYIFFDLTEHAALPQSPAYLQTNSLVLGGGAAGLAVGLLLLRLPFFGPRRER